MQQYFSHICDGTDVQADWRRRCTYGRAPYAIDISQGPLTCPSYTDTGPPFLYGDSDTPPHLVAFYDTLGYRGRILDLNPRHPHGGTLFEIFDIMLLEQYSRCVYVMSWLKGGWVSETGCFTSHATIFQLYMWRHIFVQADWRRRWTYGRAPNAIDIS